MGSVEMPVRTLAVVLAAVSVVTAAAAAPGGAQTKPGACVPTGQDRITCGSGPGALMVLDGTTSPSGNLAIAWRARSVGGDGLPEVGSVENHLVRLQDGKSLGIVVGRSWSTGEAQSNHISQTVAWSPDSNWLLVGDSGKWALEAIAIYAIDEGAGGAKRLGLFRPISLAATRLLRGRVGASKAGSYTLDIAGNEKVEVSDAGTVSLPMLFQIPKQDEDIDLIVKFKASRNGDRITTTPIDVSAVKR
jgi:hypothetical protein